METLNHTQSATDLIGDINANLREMSSLVEVAVTDSAGSLVGKLNTAFANVDGKIVLSKDMDAETFVGNMNANFEAAVQDDSGEDDYVFPTYDSAKYGSEMSDTVNKVSALSADSDLIYLISTDQHADNRSDSNYALLNPNYAWGSTVPNMREFIRLADARNIDVDAIALLGDFTDGHYTDSGTETGQERCINYVKQNMSIALVSGGKVRTGMKPLIYAVGNHDDNVDSGVYPRLYDDDLYNLYIKDNVGIGDTDNVYVFNNGIFSNYPVSNSNASHKSTIHPDYYIDYQTKKLRVIVLNCDDETEGSGKNWQIAPITRMWLAAMFGQDVNGNTLSSGDDGYGLEMPQGYKAIILCHIHPLNHGGTRVAAEKIINRNKSRILIYICGHSHCDNVTLISAAGTVNQPNGQQVISMRLASGRAENAGVGQHLGTVVPSRSKNDYTTDLWSVFALSKDRTMAHFIRFGAGFDHHVHLHNQEWQRGGSLTLSPSALAGKQVTWYVQPLPEFSAEGGSTIGLTSHIIPADINGGVLTLNEDTPAGDVYFVAYCVYNEGLPTEEREFWGIHITT